jgi:hypothetical protein
MVDRRHTAHGEIRRRASWHHGRWPLAALAAAACLGLCGCGGDRLYPVALTVRFADGKPAADCSVILRREEPPSLMGGGRVGLDGSCAPVAAGGTSPGLSAGTYRVAVTAESGPPADGGGRKPLPFSARFTDLEQSGLEIQVGPGHDPAVTLVLEP